MMLKIQFAGKLRSELIRLASVATGNRLDDVDFLL
jgi:hypothetical protein